MNRGRWLSGLVLSVSGWLPHVHAQDPWHSVATQPVPVNLSGSELLPCPVAPVAAIGRPVVLATAQPGPQASGMMSAVMPASYHAPAEPENTAMPVQPTASPTWPDDPSGPADPGAAIDQISEFASDRARPPITRVGNTGEEEPLLADDKPATDKPATAPMPQKVIAPPPLPIVPGPVEVPPAVAGVDGPIPDPFQTHFWVKGEYLLWAIRPYQTPPLAATGVPVFLANGNVSVANERILAGDSDFAGDLRSGMRLTAGVWFDMWQEQGLEVGGFFLGNQNNSFATNSAQNPVIVRPFFDLNRQAPNFEIVSFPQLQNGSLTVSAPSRFFGGEIDYTAKVCCGCDYHVNMIAGFRYLNLDEDLRITEDIQFGAAVPGLANQSASAFDDFHTKNRFYGGQIGIAGEKSWGPWSLGGSLKLGLGATTEEVDINGAQQFSNPALNARGDLLALASNIGDHTHTRFGVVPELELNVGYQVNAHMRVFVGYNFLYWADVVRPGDQIDTVLDETAIPNFHSQLAATGQDRPTVLFKESAFWAQGLNVGVEFRY